MNPKLIVNGSKQIVIKKLKSVGIEFEEQGDELELTDIDIKPFMTLCELFIDDLIIDVEGNIRMRSDNHGARW